MGLPYGHRGWLLSVDAGKARRWSILANGIVIPHCTRCYSKLLRWGWYEAPNEPIEYWYCIECDIAGRSPYIFVLPARDKSEKLHQNAMIAQKGE